ncbi:hypothetical protein [Verticiella sediminum]|uniref:hypothetical protein n=1 Tax=Verticiella sediminum TaxID=1247510 RepID=UPI0014786046|nr:hypothetical protein [Verticiella sediminum]
MRNQLAARFGVSLPAWVNERLTQAGDAELQAWTLAVLSARRLEDMFGDAGDETAD